MSEYRGDHEVHGESPFAVWGAALLKEPDATLDRILSGVGGRGSQQRAEPDDFLADLLANPDHQEIRTQLTDHLDRALLRWIEVRSEWSSRCIVAFGPRAYAAQMADALAVAARLSLKTTAGELMGNHVVWDDRFHVLRRPGDIDLLREFDMVLALHQTDVRFVPRWFAACDEAAWGSPYWQTRLSASFLGLRKLPEHTGQSPDPDRTRGDGGTSADRDHAPVTARHREPAHLDVDAVAAAAPGRGEDRDGSTACTGPRRRPCQETGGAHSGTATDFGAIRRV